MGKLLERLKRGREKLKLRIAATKEKRELKTVFKQNLAQIRTEESEERKEKRAAEIIKKQERISKVRESQLKRARLEANILKAKASRIAAQRKIVFPTGKGVELRLAGPIVQTRTMQPITMGQPRRLPPITSVKQRKKKRRFPMRAVQKPTPGLGRFRVL